MNLFCFPRLDEDKRMKSISGKISHLEAEIKYDLELLPISTISSEIYR